MTTRLGLEAICLKDRSICRWKRPPTRSPRRPPRSAMPDWSCTACGVITMRNDQQVDQAFEYAKAAGMTHIIAAPAPEMLPRIEAKVREYDLRVCIHNHGPGDTIGPPRSPATRRSGRWTSGSACATTSGTRCVTARTRSPTAKRLPIAFTMSTSRTSRRTPEGRPRSPADEASSICHACCTRCFRVRLRGLPGIRIRSRSRRPAARPGRIRRLHPRRAGQPYHLGSGTS
jgi:hypothetical protein